MKSIPIVFWAVIVLSPAVGLADIVFNVTFENPPHLLGSLTETGAGPLYPTAGAALVDNTPGFSSQAGLVAGSLGFTAPSSFTSGVHLVSWDFMNLSENTLGIGPNAALFVNQDPDTLFLAHGVLGGVRLSEVGPVTVYQEDYSLLTFASYSFLIDLDLRVYDFAVDGTTVLADQSLPEAMTSLDSFTFQRPGNNQYAIDNFHWEVVPEPSTWALLVLAGVGLAARFMLRGRSAADAITPRAYTRPVNNWAQPWP